MKCQCPHFTGDGGCLVHRLVLTERQREQCRTSEEFFAGFAHIGKPKKGPSVARLIGNASAAVVRVASAAARGQKVRASQETIEARNATCNSCEARDGQWCQHRKCGCFLPLKSTLLTETCPLGKWQNSSQTDADMASPQ